MRGRRRVRRLQLHLCHLRRADEPTHVMLRHGQYLDALARRLVGEDHGVGAEFLTYLLQY